MSKALRYAYNTNGCTNHRLDDALDLMAAAGYDGVALTLDWHHLDPFARDWKDRTERLRQKLDAYGMGCVIETGARFLLDPISKHDPTLLHPEPAGRARRVAFLKRAVEIAAILNAETVSCWAGIKPASLTTADAHDYLLAGLREVLQFARSMKVVLSLEPEPGMLIETNADYDAVSEQLGEYQQELRLALDLGHVWVTGESEPAEAVERYADRLGTVSIEGMNRGVHFHLPLHEGDMDIPPLVRALQRVQFGGLVCVELSRESPRAHQAIPESIVFLRQVEQSLAKQTT
ncbi:sugar phosphate isomerase/epimerase family protein [Lewinella sp. IMCC34191]|uniref:sugar phosphate isomerase/epimerase family protein n=1 Tax=Lewinella sp. IMCC34191 TaxID=2259172 RepID=UPI000E27BBCE|nr:sugar phosphate isomerase/epimerase family protein [Lewinella sp. IMCC34191]